MKWRSAGGGRAYIANRNILLTTVLEDLGEHTLLLELKVHLGLVGLDLNEHLAGGDGVAGLLLPGANISRRHGGRQGGHLDDGVRRVRSVPSCEAGDGDAREAGVLEGLPPDERDEHFCGEEGC